MNDGIDREDLQKALTVLRNGGTVAYPTETVWGIGCDSTDDDSIRKIFRLKRREDSKAMISLVADLSMLERWVDDIPEAAYQLMDVAVRPLTIIYDHPRGLSPLLLAEDGSAAFRITSDPYAKALCRALKKPLVSTSANISGNKTPSTFKEISEEIKSGVDYVAEWGRNREASGNPSTVIKVSDGDVIKIIRE